MIYYIVLPSIAVAILMSLSVCIILYVNRSREDTLKVLFSLSNVQIEGMIKTARDFLKLHENEFKTNEDGQDSGASQYEGNANNKELSLNIANSLTGKRNMESKGFTGGAKEFIKKIAGYFILILLLEFLCLYNCFKDLAWTAKIKKLKVLLINMGRAKYSHIYGVTLT